MSIRLKQINKHVYFVAGTMLAAAGMVLSLAWDALKVVREDTSFERKIVQNNIQLMAVMPRDRAIDDVAGASEAHYYFQTKAPGTIMITDRQLTEKKYVNFKLAANKKFGTFFFSSVDSPWVEILSANTHAVVRGNINDSLQMTILPTKIFTRAVKVSPDTYIIRGFDSAVKTIDQIFKKINIKTGRIHREKFISERRNDGGMTTDGELLFDEKTNLLTYIQFYTNKMVCLDTNLNVIYEGKTFGSEDSLEKNMALSSTGVLASASPKRTLNSSSCVADGFVFNHSKAVSRSEVLNNQRSENTIDVYDVRTGKYMQSFHVPYVKGQSVYKFKIFKKTLIVLYRDYIAAYQMSLPDNI